MPKSLRNLLSTIASGDWLVPERIFAYSAILLGFELLAFVYLVAATHGWLYQLKQPVSADFVSFYAAGRLALAGSPAAAYVQHLHYAAEQQATPGVSYALFFYPPVFILLCAPFALLPYSVSLIAFETATLAACLAALVGIVRRPDDRRKWALLLPLLAFPPMLINFGVGQNGFLTAALFGGATLLIDRRPGLAGILFGALCYKPHFGLLVPLALAAGGRWRAFAAAAITVTALVALSALLFGWETWRGFAAAFLGSRANYESGQIDFGGFVSVFGALRLLGAGSAPAYAVQAAVSLGAAVLVAKVWRGEFSLPTRAATLAAATLAAVPLALYYDLVLGGIAIAWLVRAGRARGFFRWEKSLLLLIYAAPILVRSLAASFRWPIGALIPLILLCLCAVQARLERRHGAPSGI